MYEQLPEIAVEITGISDATYQRYRTLKRKSLDLSTEAPLNPFCSPAEFILWRQTVAWNKFLNPSAAAFAAAVAINVGYIQNFEASERKQLPPAIIAALTACGASLATDDFLELKSG